MEISRSARGAVLLVSFIMSNAANALDVAATTKALRLASIITGGYLPTSDPLFTQMVNQVAAGDTEAAAATAAKSKHFASYLARRLALQMQTPALEAADSLDSDATAFLIAHFAGTSTVKPSLSTIWSENATYLVNVNGTNVRAAALTPAQLAALDWSAALVQVPGQTAKTQNGTTFTPVTIPPQHVGGYVTLSDRGTDKSFAAWAATAGTNLRYIEGIWQIATGLGIMDFASTQAKVADVPRFISQYDPNFFKGSGQPACLSCHGGGLASLTKGYATVADTFNFDAAQGLIYIANPTNATRKSLGSDPGKRAAIATCNLAANPSTTCNPDSAGVDPNQGWDLDKVWAESGVLKRLGWTGATSGQGLNRLGQELGKATLVYENFVVRVVNEICPMGMFTQTDVSRIAAAANPYATPAGTDDIRTIVAKVASHQSCH